MIFEIPGNTVLTLTLIVRVSHMITSAKVLESKSPFIITMTI